MSETFPGGQHTSEALPPSGQEAETETAQSPERDEQRLHPAIWIGSLLDYNNGMLHGDWMDAAREDEAVQSDVQAILARSPTSRETGEVAEEWGIFDYEDFGGWKPGEYEDLGVVAAVARGISEHGAAFAAWAELHDADPDMLASFEDCYLGEYDSPEAWAKSWLEETGSLEEVDGLLEEKVGDLARYVRLDTGAWVQDAYLSGDISIVHKSGGGVWIFRTNP